MKNEGCAELLTNETTWHGGRQPSLLSPNLAYCGTRVFPQNLIHLVNPPRNKGHRKRTAACSVYILYKTNAFCSYAQKILFEDFSDLVIVISTL